MIFDHKVRIFYNAVALVSDPKLKRMLGAYSLNKGGKAPALVGLERPLEQAAVLFFFESDCYHCRRELDDVIRNYNEIRAKGYRVISIAADVDRESYENTSVAFIWDRADSLCDFKGFDGENFRNYGVIGTPTIFVVDKDGVIMGRYARVMEMGI